MTDSNLVIDANPTKDFFISMLVKDLELVRAIIDLIDNCVDGALRLRGNDNFRDLRIEITANQEHFIIKDNCGGISVDIARSFAFRFGRPIGMESTAFSIGQFGVGMKRALFKLGSKFIIESTTETSRFLVEEDVDEWKSKQEWEFHFKELETNLKNISQEQQGTTITVSSLHDNVVQDFRLELFINKLRHQIKDAHQQSINKGLLIVLNGIPLESRILNFVTSDVIKPVYIKKIIEKNDSSIEIKIYVGLAESEPSEAGWYIYCNGRMIIGADKTIITGWGEGGETAVSRYHNRYARFRGFVFFNSDDAALLPWNTTKTGVDTDSPIYRSIRIEMISIMRPVNLFLRRLETETTKEDTDDKTLEEQVNEAKSTPITDVVPSSKFVAPKRSTKPALPRTGRIQYNKPIEQIDKIKKILKVSTYKEVGERTFEYFFELECEE